MATPRSVEEAQRSIREALVLSQKEAEAITQEEVGDVLSLLTNIEAYLELQLAFTDEGEEETLKKLNTSIRQVNALKKTFELIKKKVVRPQNTQAVPNPTAARNPTPDSQPLTPNVTPRDREPVRRKEKTNETTARFISFLKSSESRITYGFPTEGSREEQENNRVYFSLLSDELKQSFEADQQNLSDQEAVERLFQNEKFRKRLKAYTYQKTYLFLEEQTPTGHVNADEFPKLFTGSGVSYRLDNFLGGFPESQKAFAQELRKEYLCSITHHNRAAIFLQDTDNTEKFLEVTAHYAAGTGPWGGKSLRIAFTDESEDIFARSFAGDFERPSKSFFPHAYARIFPDQKTYLEFCASRDIRNPANVNWNEKSPYNSKIPKKDEDFIRECQTRSISNLTTETPEEDQMLDRARANLGVKRCRDYFFWTGDAAKLDYDGNAGLGIAKAFNAGSQGTHPHSKAIDVQNGLYAVGYHVQTAGKGRPSGSEPLLYRQAFYLLPYSWYMESSARRTGDGEVLKEPLFVTLADPDADYSSEAMKKTLKATQKKENDFALQARFGIHRYKGVIKEGGLLPNLRSIVKSTLLLDTGPLIERGLRPAKDILEQLKYEFDGKAINQMQVYLQYDAQYQRTFLGPHWTALAFRKEPEYYYDPIPNSNRYNYSVNLKKESFDYVPGGPAKFNTLGAIDPVLKRLCDRIQATTDDDERSKLATEIDKHICLVDLCATLRTLVPADPDVFNWPIPIKTFQSESSLSGKLLSILGAVPVLNEVERHQVEQLYTVGIQNLATAAASEGTSIPEGVSTKFTPPVFTSEEIHKVFRTAGVEGPSVPSVGRYDDYLWNGLVRAKRNLTAHPSINLPK